MFNIATIVKFKFNKFEFGLQLNSGFVRAFMEGEREVF
jgi:hypothetical protein